MFVDKKQTRQSLKTIRNKKKERTKGLGMKRLTIIFVLALMALVLTACPAAKPPVVNNGSFAVSMNAVDIVKSSSDVSKTMTVTISSKNGFSGEVELELQGLPTNVEQSWNPKTTSGTTAQVTITVKANAADYNGPITLKGVSGSKEASKIVNLRISDKKDTTRPTVVSLKPAPNSKGVLDTTKFEIEFSEPMDQLAAQNAFEDLAGSAPNQAFGQVSFSWSNDGKTMYVKPINGLKYSNNNKALQYAYRISTTAKDLAGNKLDTANSNRVSTFFFTYRTLFMAIRSTKALDGYVNENGGAHTLTESILIGDTNDNRGIRGFLSFDLGALPAETLRIKDAQLTLWKKAEQGNNLGALVVESVNYGSVLDKTDFAVQGNNLETMQVQSNDVYVTKSMRASVQADWLKRNSNGSRSQFRLRFSTKTDSDNQSDWIKFWSAEAERLLRPRLVVGYLVP